MWGTEVMQKREEEGKKINFDSSRKGTGAPLDRRLSHLFNEKGKAAQINTSDGASAITETRKKKKPRGAGNGNPSERNRIGEHSCIKYQTIRS